MNHWTSRFSRAHGDPAVACFLEQLRSFEGPAAIVVGQLISICKTRLSELAWQIKFKSHINQMVWSSSCV